METDLSKLIKYSEKYCDSQYEYRHVSLPEAISRKVSLSNYLPISIFLFIVEFCYVYLIFNLSC